MRKIYTIECLSMFNIKRFMNKYKDKSKYDMFIFNKYRFTNKCDLDKINHLFFTLKLKGLNPELRSFVNLKDKDFYINGSDLFFCYLQEELSINEIQYIEEFIRHNFIKTKEYRVYMQECVFLDENKANLFIEDLFIKNKKDFFVRER